MNFAQCLEAGRHIPDSGHDEWMCLTGNTPTPEPAGPAEPLWFLLRSDALGQQILAVYDETTAPRTAEQKARITALVDAWLLMWPGHNPNTLEDWPTPELVEWLRPRITDIGAEARRQIEANLEADRRAESGS